MYEPFTGGIAGTVEVGRMFISTGDDKDEGLLVMYTGVVEVDIVTKAGLLPASVAEGMSTVPVWLMSDTVREYASAQAPRSMPLRQQ